MTSISDLVNMPRRSFLMGTAALLAGSTVKSFGESAHATVYRNPGCGCCEKWAEHLRTGGFTADVIERDDLDTLRIALGVPQDLAGCHTAKIDGYVIEGHVPVAAVTRLLHERPKAIGIAVAGMPAGSPGMEGGRSEVYEVVLFGQDTRQGYGRFRGQSEVK